MAFAVVVVLGLTAAPSADAAGPGTTGGEDSWLSTLLEPLENLSHWVTGLFRHEDRFVPEEIERFKRTVDTDLTGFDALVRQAGFRVGTISVAANLIPRVGLSLEFVRRLSESEKAALMAKITDSAGGVGIVERSVIMTLLNAADSGYAVRSDGFRLTGVEIDLDVVPDVTFLMSGKP
ncbi:MAG: hypothetical protein WCF85_06455 [Rhodospirillaceae bacterium]